MTSLRQGFRAFQESQAAKKGATFAATFHYTGGQREHSLQRPASDEELQAPDVEYNDLSRGRRSVQATGMNGYTAPTDPPPGLYVRALYNYDADDHTSLSFRQGDIIQVLTQLESGWWDGVINDVRGWFPSNYCTVLSDPEDPNEPGSVPHDESDNSADSGTEEEEYDDAESGGDDQDDDSDLPIEGGESHTQEEAAFWIPQATPDGRLFYFNTLTGVSTMELPLETPTSADETGPRDRSNFHVPDQTRPPPEMMARGFEQNEDDYDGSASEADGESGLSSSKHSLPDRRTSFLSAGVSSSNSVESLNASSFKRDQRPFHGLGPSITMSQQASNSLMPLGTTETSFTTGPHPNLTKPAASRYFPDDGAANPLTWNSLVDDMRTSIDAYRQAIRNQERAEFVRRAEDISDHLRMLLAAGSGTTDNHSGNPSIISANKALYPHFREMMSKFSKLVLSSHIAAADWPGPDASAKCLQEADGVLHGVYGYVEVARQQRGEQIPRITPGFMLGSNTGGNWQDNNVDSRFGTEATSFIHQDDTERRSPTAPLDTNLLRRIEEARKSLSGGILQLEERLHFTEKVITPSRQDAMGDNICAAAGVVIEYYRPWINQVESVDLAPVGSIFHKPQLVDYGAQKQSVYDAIGELIAACQAVTTPLPDEWAEVRGLSLETRLNSVRSSCRQLDERITHVGYTLQLLLEASLLGPSSSTNKREHRLTDGGEIYQNAHLHAEPAHALNQRPHLAEIGQSHSYTIGQDPSTEKFRRPPNNHKARQFFGQIPPSHNALKGLNVEPVTVTDENPWYLQLDHLSEVSYTDTDPPQLKSGTLTGLVETLTRHDRLDPLFNATFLLTYRSFMSAAELFERLVGRFNIQPPPGLKRHEYATWEERKQRPVRFRVVNILKSWFEHYWMEINDEANKLLLERAYNFAKTTIATTKTPGSGPLMAVIDQRIKGQDTSAKRLVLTLNTSAPVPILPKNMKKLKFLDIDATEFARQLTIVESKLYGKIKPIECLDKTWQKKPKNDTNDESVDLAPNVKSLILHSNQLTNWVAEMILSQAEVKKRVVVIKHFVAIADKCRQLNNFSTLTSIVSALGTAPILRLNRTWQQVNPKTNATLESMRNLIASTKNFAVYREQLHQANPPCIPFLGVYLTDLTFIEDGIASVVKNTELINFTKRAKTADVIRDIQQYQNVPYSLNSVPDLQEWMLENMQAAGDVHEMYNKSLQIEPRENGEEKIARLLSESGFL